MLHDSPVITIHTYICNIQLTEKEFFSEYLLRVYFMSFACIRITYIFMCVYMDINIYNDYITVIIYSHCIYYYLYIIYINITIITKSIIVMTTPPQLLELLPAELWQGFSLSQQFSHHHFPMWLSGGSSHLPNSIV